MRVKICGITSVSDAKMAEDAGADAIGVIVCSDSPRNLSFEEAGEILASVGPFVTTVCVSHTTSEDDLRGILALRPHAVQIFHDLKVPPESGVKVLRAVAPGGSPSEDCSALIIDGSHGKGRQFDSVFAKTLVKRSRVPVILAGGLTPENVRAAIEEIKPYAVDVASGVECKPGVKDKTKVRNFMKICRGVEL